MYAHSEDSNTSRLVKGNNFIDTKEYGKAIECFDEALKINPNFDDARKQKDAVVSLRYDNQDFSYNKHQTHETTAVGSSTRQNISDANNWNNKGISLYNLKKYKEAIECS